MSADLFLNHKQKRQTAVHNWYEIAPCLSHLNTRRTNNVRVQSHSLPAADAVVTSVTPTAYNVSTDTYTDTHTDHNCIYHGTRVIHRLHMHI